MQINIIIIVNSYYSCYHANVFNDVIIWQENEMNETFAFMLACLVWFDSFYVRASTITAIKTIGYRFKSTPMNGSRFTARQSSLVATHPSTNRGRRALTSVNVPLS